MAATVMVDLAIKGYKLILLAFFPLNCIFSFSARHQGESCSALKDACCSNIYFSNAALL